MANRHLGTTLQTSSDLRAGYGAVSFLAGSVPDLSLYCFVVHLNAPVTNNKDALR